MVDGVLDSPLSLRPNLLVEFRSITMGGLSVRNFIPSPAVEQCQIWVEHLTFAFY